MRVRLVHLEDDEADRELVARTLRPKGLTAPSCRPTAARISSGRWTTPPDLILSDYSIPGFGGDEAQSLAQRAAPTCRSCSCRARLAKSEPSSD